MERNPITVMSQVLIGGVVMTSAISGLDSPIRKKHSMVVQQPSPVVLNSGDTPVVADFSSVNRNKVGPMMGAYWGIQSKNGVVPSKIKIDWSLVLANLWGKKINITGVSPATQKNAANIVLKYAEETKKTKSLHEFITGANDTITVTSASLDYDELCQQFNITTCEAFKAVTRKITGEMLVAYGLTEIFPAHDGTYNVKALDITLHSAGENYINSIPALGDGFLSKGFYQFTSLAVCRGVSCADKGGVTKVDDFAGGKLPGSVIYLDGADHHKAAFEFAVYNIAMLARELSATDMAQLEKCPIDDLTAFIATAHHMPARAVDNAKSWVKHKCAKPYVVYSGPHLKEYALKTTLNLKAVQKYMKEEMQ